MQINVADSNIVSNEGTIIKTGNEKEFSVKDSTKVKEEEGYAYRKSKRVDKNITYSKKADGEEASESVNNKEDMADIIDKLDTMITPEGYDQMEELGIIPDDENPELSVSVYERIQMELAAYCEDYVPTGLNIDSKKLEKFLGSAAFANTVDKAMSIRNIDEQAKVSIVADENINTLSIDSLYEKVYSSRNREDRSSQITAEVWKELKPQAEKILDKVGIEMTEEVENITKWMVSNGIPVTAENISKAMSLEKTEKLSDGEYKNIVEKNIAYTLYFKGSVKGASVEKNQYETDGIYEGIDSIKNITDGQLEKLINDGKTLNFENIKKYSKENAEEKDKKAGAVISARKVVIEATLVMTVPSLMRVKQLGVNIDITELTTLLEKIYDMEKEEAGKFLQSVNTQVTEDKLSSFISTNNAVTAIRSAHISFVASIEKTDTLYEVGKKAVNAYESSATEVRKDLGDSYEKAFSNVDDILRDMNLETSEENKRAVRILGYNAMSITTDSIEQVREMAGQVDYLVENLTPKTVAYLISEDINPMDKNITELNRELSNINEDIGITEENFAEFLWKLEKSDGISETDREKYISVFRNIKSITKKDIQAVGALINSNMEFTMDNLMAAVKSRKITGDIYKWKEDRSYTEYRIGREAEADVTEDEVKQLINNHIAVTPRNIKNTGKLRNKSDVFEDFYESSEESIKDIIDNILDADNEEELKESFELLRTESKKSVKNQIHKDFPLYSDIETALENSGLARLVSEYAKNESYYIPVKIGNSVTNIHLTLKTGENESRAYIHIKEGILGELNLELYEEKAAVKGMLVYGNKENRDSVSQLANDFTDNLRAQNINIEAINVVNSETYFETDSGNREKASKGSGSNLYTMAKIFITTVRAYETEVISR